MLLRLKTNKQKTKNNSITKRKRTNEGLVSETKNQKKEKKGRDSKTGSGWLVAFNNS